MLWLKTRYGRKAVRRIVTAAGLRQAPKVPALVGQPAKSGAVLADLRADRARVVAGRID